MPGQFIAATIMFLVTIGIAGAFWLPALNVHYKNALVKFYWMGFWSFLGGLTAIAGAQAVLVILGQHVERFGGAMLSGVSTAFVVFVMFAWVRLTLKGLSASLKK
ncbi:MAG TPA: hypothetical protein ENK01_04275 [Hellea balneolensis]|uniref:Uncharacterized protein n=1 Tax=Hellea balneolensis TaxID=287478 RepID=A0A7V5NY29_9PROT|nr:hypothetical protein [Hellea balneolensis]